MIECGSRAVLPSLEQGLRRDGGVAETCEKVGLTGLEPVTLRLSSACSNQLSYRPVSRPRRGTSEFQLPISILFPGALSRAFT